MNKHLFSIALLVSLSVSLTHSAPKIISADTLMKDASSPQASIANTEEIDTPSTLETFEAVTIVDTMLDEARKQLSQTYSVLSGLSGMVSNNQLPAVHNRKEMLNNIKQMNQLIQTILQEKFVQTDLQSVDFLLRLNHSIMQHVLIAIRKGFKTLPPYDPTSVITRAPARTPDPERLYAQIEKSKKLVEEFTKEADHAGLRWYNHLYRSIDKWVIHPCQKYSIPQRTALAAATAGGIMWAWWRMSAPTGLTPAQERAAMGQYNNPGDAEINANEGRVPGSWEQHCPRIIQDFYGPRPLETGFGAILNQGRLHTFGKLEANVASLLRGQAPIGHYLIAASIGGIGLEWKDHFGPWMTEKLSVITNKLKGGAYLREAQKAAHEVDDVSFKDLVGLDHVKREFSILVDYLQNPEPYDRLGLTPPKGILLIGDSRTGKTFSVKALWGEITQMYKKLGTKNEFSFFDLDASDIDQHGIGYLLSLIKNAAPCVVFIDEIDLLDLQRKGKNKILSEFLTYMSGTMDTKDPKNQVVIIAATNRPENLDEALRQPGRFGKELRFEFPSYAERQLYLRRKLDKLSLSLDKFNIEMLAEQTEGKSYEALNILINKAVLKARIHNQIVTQEHIEQTLDEELRHVVNIECKDIPAHERQLLATHFAGHALTLHLLDMHTKLAKVTIKQVMTDIKEVSMGMHLYYPKEKDENKKRFEYGKIFTHHHGDSININTRQEKLALIKYHLSGIIAEEIISGSCGYSVHAQDMEHALALAESLAFEGLEMKNLPKHIQKERFDEAFAILAQCKKEVTKLLTQHRDKLELIIAALQDRETLTAQDMREIMAE
jgi:cell division protease FtsH